MRLIDADDLLMEMGAGCLPIFEKGISGVTGDESTIKDYIDEAPTIDAVEVVRCKDCIHTTRSKVNPEKIICCLTLMCGTTEPDFFCAHGEHKMNAEVEGC